MKNILYKLSIAMFLLGSSFTVLAQNFSFYSLGVAPAGFKEAGEVKGYYVDILKRIGEELGVATPKVTLGPYPRLLKALNENKSGFVLTILFPSNRFGNLVQQPNEVGHFTTGIITTKGSPLAWNTINGKKIATVKGASKVYGDKFHSRVESGDIKLISVTDYNQAIKMIKGGRIDGFAGNLAPLLNLTKKVKLDIDVPLVIAEKVSNITVSVAPGTPDADATVAKIGNIVNKMIVSGEIQNIIESYLPEAVQPR